MKSLDVPCPCGGTITIVTRSLVTGAHFTCPRCQASVSLAPSCRAEVASALEELETLKKKARQHGDDSRIH